MPVAAERIAGLVALAIVAISMGCKKEAAQATSSPESGADGAQLADPIVSLERELDDIDARMNAAGLARSTDRERRKLEQPTSPPPPREDDVAAPKPTKHKEPAPKPTVEPTTKAPEPTGSTKSGDQIAPGSTAPQCEPLCDLASTSCDLQTRVCELADEHEGEPRYEDACLRAQDQCRVATEACAGCNGAG